MFPQNEDVFPYWKIHLPHRNVHFIHRDVSKNTHTHKKTITTKRNDSTIGRCVALQEGIFFYRKEWFPNRKMCAPKGSKVPTQEVAFPQQK